MTGIPFNLDGGRTWDSPSLDRIKSDKGYTPENTRVVLYCINVMANTWGENKIVEIAEAIMTQRRSRSAELQQRLESALKRRLSLNSSPEFELTWKHWDLPSGPPICALRASARRTSDNGCGGWPTPTQSDGSGGRMPADPLVKVRPSGAKVCQTLGGAAALAAWPSPAARDWKGAPASMESFERNDNARPLNEVARLAGWATPAAKEAGGTPEQFLARKEKARENGAQLGVSLTSLSMQAQLSGWPTPCGQDGPKGGPGQGSDRLPGAAALSSTAQTEKRGALDPAFSRWLMGFPPAWDISAPKSQRGSKRR